MGVPTRSCRAADVNADGEKFPLEWLFHFRWSKKKACTDFHGNAIVFKQVAGRTSAIVPKLQTLSDSGVGKKRKR